MEDSARQNLIIDGIHGTYATLTICRSNTDEDFSQRVEFSTDLETWPFSGVEVSASDLGDGTRHERSGAPLPQRFPLHPAPEFMAVSGFTLP